MALFTDGSIATLADLKAYESSILDLASTEGIDLEAKLAIARRELALDVASFLLKRRPQPSTQRDLSNVIVTEPVLHAHVNRTLALIYRDVCNSQLNDRYQNKWKQYSEISANSLKLLFEIGVGIAAAPISRAVAPSVTTVVGGLLPETAYYVRVAGVGSAGVSGALSDFVRLTATANTLLHVSLPSLPSGASGWVIYAGESESSMNRQNEILLPAMAGWTATDSGLRTDLNQIPEQKPDIYVANQQQFLRG